MIRKIVSGLFRVRLGIFGWSVLVSPYLWKRPRTQISGCREPRTGKFVPNPEAIGLRLSSNDLNQPARLFGPKP